MVAAMFDVDESDVSLLLEPRLVKVRALGEITLTDLVEHAHPSTFDALIVIEEVTSPTPDELEAWSRPRSQSRR